MATRTKTAGKKWVKPENADKARLKTQEIRGTRGTEKLKSGLRRGDRAHATTKFKEERSFEHGERRTTRVNLTDQSIRAAAARGAMQDARQRSYAQYMTGVQLERQQARQQARQQFQEGQKPNFLQRNVQQPVVESTENTTQQITLGLFKAGAIMVALSALYLLVSHGDQSAGVIGAVGGFFARLTRTVPLVSVKSNMPL